MKKSRIITAVLAFSMALATMFVFAACGTVKGEGGIAPEGYYEVEKDGSSFYLPPNFSKQSASGTMTIYTFGGGNFNVVSAPIQKKAKDYTEKFMKNQYKLASSTMGVSMSVDIDEFKKYELSGLLIVYIETTTSASGQQVKQYQFVYDTDDSQISLTLTFDSVAAGESSDIPQNILYSISLN